MKNIIFIAPPASGKGTQSDFLVKNFGYVHVSTSDLLRDEVASGSEFGKEISDIMSSGNLVSDEIVTKLLTNKLKSIDKPFILDGYPRNVKQIHILEDIMKEIGKSIDIVIYLDAEEDMLVKRATGRLICPKCGKTYHKLFIKPKNENICDECDVELISRSDDTEETFRIRYKNYIDNTKPVLDYYEENNMLVKVDSNDIDECFENIKKVINL